MIVLIPAYEPTTSLADVARELRLFAPDLRVVVVDDGSGPDYDAAFRAASAEDAEVLRYDHNRGKGHALKTGLRHVRASYPGEAVVTADSDGQHSPTDIVRVAERLASATDTIVLGGRRFAGEVPLRSRVGNAISRGAFRAVTGRAVHDTQTGLRGFPASAIDWLLTIEGDRFEYELQMLLRARDAGLYIDEIPIETIYLEQNASSHFRPVVDSLRVMRPLLVFGLVSLASFLLDILVLELLYLLTSSLVVAVVGARAVSGTANFLANRTLVFRAGSRRALLRDAVRYVALALAVLAASYAGIAALTGAGVPLLLAKVATDVTLYLVSYLVQRRFVFARSRPGAVLPQPDAGSLGEQQPGSLPEVHVGGDELVDRQAGELGDVGDRHLEGAERSERRRLPHRQRHGGGEVDVVELRPLVEHVARGRQTRPGRPGSDLPEQSGDADATVEGVV
jgi:glycosyltransferase involved in cell wall biosynthesis